MKKMLLVIGLLLIAPAVVTFAQGTTSKSKAKPPAPAAPVAAPELSLEQKKSAKMIADSFKSKLEVVEAFMKEAKWLQQTEKVPAAFFVGLAILESAGFNSELYQKAQNPFGMKATKPQWNGTIHKMWHEGQMTDFRKYATPREAVSDFSKFLKSRRWFQDAFKCQTTDVECFITSLMANAEKKEPGYARDPEWGNKIRRVIKKYKLEALSE